MRLLSLSAVACLAMLGTLSDRSKPGPLSATFPSSAFSAPAKFRSTSSSLPRPRPQAERSASAASKAALRFMFVPLPLMWGNPSALACRCRAPSLPAPHAPAISPIPHRHAARPRRLCDLGRASALLQAAGACRRGRDRVAPDHLVALLPRRACRLVAPMAGHLGGSDHPAA